MDTRRYRLRTKLPAMQAFMKTFATLNVGSPISAAAVDGMAAKALEPDDHLSHEGARDCNPSSNWCVGSSKLLLTPGPPRRQQPSNCRANARWSARR